MRHSQSDDRIWLSAAENAYKALASSPQNSIKQIWVAAISKRKPELAEGITREKDWRHGYAPHLVKVAHAMAEDRKSVV